MNEHWRDVHFGNMDEHDYTPKASDMVEQVMGLIEQLLGMGCVEEVKDIYSRLGHELQDRGTRND